MSEQHGLPDCDDGRDESIRMRKAAASMTPVFALALGIAGCASQVGAVTPGGSGAASAPRVQNCGVVAISSPPKYACNGKVYTALELERLRLDEAKKYRSGR